MMQSTSELEQGTDSEQTSLAIWLAAAVSALGGLLFGYDWVVIGGAKPFYEAALKLTSPSDQAWAVSCALIGCLVGAALSGQLSDRFGRKKALIVAAFLFTVTSLGTAIAQNFAAFVGWRVFGGIAIGLASGLSPMYIAEIAPANRRGQLVSLNQLALVAGLLAAQIVNWLIARPPPAHASLDVMALSWNGTIGWRLMFAATAVPSALFMVGAAFLPESPRWFAQQGRWDDAEQALRRFGGAEYAERSLATMRSATDSLATGDLRSVLATPRLRRLLAIASGLAILQQWCGINVVFNYATDIFASAGFDVSDALFNIVATGVVNLAFTVLATMVVERVGRRKMMLIGTIGLALLYVLIGTGFLAGASGRYILILVLAAIATYALTLAPVTWILMAELIPKEARGASMAVATTSLWVACFILTYSFPLINHAAGTGWTFYLYAAVCSFGAVFIFRAVPETRGKTLETI